MSNIIYTLVLLLIRLLFESRTIKIWTRNSLYFKRIIFLRSDIDLTIYGENICEIKRTCTKVNHLKKLIPIIGEINIYTKSDINNKIPFNSYELSRDPILKALITTQNSRTPPDKIVFLFKMLESNRGKLFSTKKWNFYCSLINEAEVSSLENAQKLLNDLIVDYGARVSMKELFLNFIENLTLALHHQELNILQDKLINLNTSEISILNSVLIWEIRGVLSQRVFLNEEQLRQHFHNIDYALSILIPNNFLSAYPTLDHIEHFNIT